MAQWKEIDGYPGYSVSSEGEVIGSNGRVLKGFIRNSYLSVRLYRDRQYKNACIHRIVCAAFHPLILGSPYVDHINRDKLDNRAVNLRWVTSSENGLNCEHKMGASGHRLIYLTKVGTYNVLIKRDMAYVFNKTYKTLDEAIAARDNFLASL
jgi:hypothetical protein